MKILKLFCAAICVALAAGLFSACGAEQKPDKESSTLNLFNMLDCKDLEPFVSMKYPQSVRMRDDTLVLEHQFIGRMVTLEPDGADPQLPYFTAVVMLVKSYDDPRLTLDNYLNELDGYMLEHDFEHHTTTDVIVADGDYFFAFPGRGYVVSGIVSQDGPLQGMAFSEEFRNYVLPGNVNLRVIFKYPSLAQNNDKMRNYLEKIMASVLVHANAFNLAGDTSLKRLDK